MVTSDNTVVTADSGTVVGIVGDVVVTKETYDGIWGWFKRMFKKLFGGK